MANPVTTFAKFLRSKFGSETALKRTEIFPNPITTTNYRPPTNQANGTEEKPRFVSTNYNQKSPQFQLLIQSFYKTLKTKADLFKMYEDLKNTETVQTIINVMIDDGFYSMTPDKLFTATYLPEGDIVPDPEIQFEINKFVNVFKLNELVGDILEDLLLYGEYYFLVKWEEGIGITAIRDVLDAKNVIEVNTTLGTRYYLVYDDCGNTITYQSDEIIYFCLSPRKIRIKNTVDCTPKKGFSRSKNAFDSLGKTYGTENPNQPVNDNLNEFTDGPMNIRVGRSVIYSAVDKLRDVKLLDVLGRAQALRQIVTPNIIMLGMPAATPPERVSDILKTYETKLQDFADIDVQNADINELLQAATQIKLLPNYQDGRGSLDMTNLSIGNESAGTADQSVDALKSDIAAATGIPPYYLTGEGGAGKLETLKQFSRYTRKLSSFQLSVGDGLVSLIYLHLLKKGIHIERQNIKIKFKPAVNVDMLDDIEYMTGVSSAIGTFVSFAKDVEDSEFNIRVNKPELTNWMNNMLNSFPYMDRMFYIDKNAPPPAESDQGSSSDEENPEPVKEPSSFTNIEKDEEGDEFSSEEPESADIASEPDETSVSEPEPDETEEQV